MRYENTKKMYLIMEIFNEQIFSFLHKFYFLINTIQHGIKSEGKTITERLVPATLFYDSFSRQNIAIVLDKFISSEILFRVASFGNSTIYCTNHMRKCKKM